MNKICNNCGTKFIDPDYDEEVNEICPECESQNIDDIIESDDIDEDFYEGLTRQGKANHDGLEREVQDDYR